MSKESDTQLNHSNCKEEVVRLVIEREDTMSMRFRKIALKSFVVLFIFCLGFSLCELRHTKPYMLPLVELTMQEQYKLLTFYSLLEKDWKVSRFCVRLFYSEDNVYARVILAVFNEDEICTRIYFDTKRSGIFDVMSVYENGTRNIYRLNELSWEKIAEHQSHSAIIDFETLFSILEEQFEGH